ncbi:MAG TPA: alpha/beta fold hydrolase [Pseudonocardiaceae bacterium]|jgi:pimeloyl-ACP methyl ester carboxylesterase
MRLYVHQWGSGPRIVFVHGAVLGGREAWRAQRPLTEHWTVLAPDRPGHGNSPDGPSDFEPEAHLVAAQLLDEPAHLVGLSYGAIVAMYAAPLRPDLIRSLTVIEPPSSAVAAGVPVVDQFGRDVRAAIETPAEPAEALRRFFRVAGVFQDVTEPVPDVLVRGITQLADTRPPDEARPPLAELAAAPFPIMVVSGGHSEANEIICDTVAEATGARREVLPGAGHLVPDLGAPFNNLLSEFIRA